MIRVKLHCKLETLFLFALALFIVNSNRILLSPMGLASGYYRPIKVLKIYREKYWYWQSILPFPNPHKFSRHANNNSLNFLELLNSK